MRSNTLMGKMPKIPCLGIKYVHWCHNADLRTVQIFPCRFEQFVRIYVKQVTIRYLLWFIVLVQKTHIYTRVVFSYRNMDTSHNEVAIRNTDICINSKTILQWCIDFENRYIDHPNCWSTQHVPQIKSFNGYSHLTIAEIKPLLRNKVVDLY